MIYHSNNGVKGECMSDTDLIMQQLKELSAKVNLLLSKVQTDPNRSYNLREFTQELGISPYKLKNWYQRDSLPIPAPYRVNGKDPVFTGRHVELLREMML